MKTLYDLLGALPGDDAETLRIAFRKAVKGAHPDLNPGDPDAALKFRQIVRAHDILADDEQRSAYDHLLDLAEAEQAEAARRAAAATMRKISFAAMALAGVLVAIAAGCLLYLQTPATEAGHDGMPMVAAAPEQRIPADALEQILRFDPGLATVDSERNAMLQRLQEFERAFAAASPSDPAAAGHRTHAPKAAKRTEGTPQTTPPLPPRRRMAEQDPSRGMGFSIVSGAVTPH
jgi:curved DNA-binding protein CbpA